MNFQIEYERFASMLAERSNGPTDMGASLSEPIAQAFSCVQLFLRARCANPSVDVQTNDRVIGLHVAIAKKIRLC